MQIWYSNIKDASSINFWYKIVKNKKWKNENNENNANENCKWLSNKNQQSQTLTFLTFIPKYADEWQWCRWKTLGKF